VDYVVEVLVKLGGWTAEQWGLVTSAQAGQEGIDGAQLGELTQAALLTRVGGGVYRLAGAPPTEHLEIKVAWLRLDPSTPAWSRMAQDRHSGVVSHSSACRMHQLGDLPSEAVEILVQGKLTDGEQGVRLHHDRIAPSDITVVDGLPVTTVERTITDLLQAGLDGGHVGAVIADAERDHLVSINALAGRVAPFARSYGLSASAGGQDLIDHLMTQACE
jgi:predicted transcriptional regulator of viral defense system